MYLYRSCFCLMLCALIVLSLLTLGASPAASADGAENQGAARSVNAFALRAAGNLGAASEGDFFLSPWSVVTAMGMTYAGAKGETARQMEGALLFTPELHASLGALAKELTAQLDGQEGRSALTSANRIWVRKGLKLLPGFTKTLAQDYGSEAAQIDFKKDPEGARSVVNRWVEERTNQRIRDLLHKVDPDTQMILTNAVYFRGQWEYPFNEDRTAPTPFHITASEVKDVPMMRQLRNLDYGEADGVKLLRLPYGGRLVMFLALPEQGGMDKTLEALAGDPALFDRWRGALTQHRVDLWLPKFKVERRYEMSALLGDLGVKRAFGNGADFSGMTEDESLKIDSVIHQTFIDVTERETEAAAATAVTMMRTTSLPRPQEIPKAEFHAERPFLHFIVDEPTGAILFVGRQSFR